QGLFQFHWLATRYLELLKNDTGNLLILLLQAPVIGVLLMAMAHIQMGTGIFQANNVVQCQTRAVSASNKLEISMPQASRETTINCSEVLTFLKNNKTVKISTKNPAPPPAATQAQNSAQAQNPTPAQIQAFVNKKGGIEQALQDFILQGY